MARQTRAERRRERTRQELVGTGWMAIVVGVLLLTVIPAFMQGPLLGSLGQAVRPLGWLAMLFGAVLVGLHHVISRITTPAKIDQVEPWRGTRSSPKTSRTTKSRKEPVLAPAFPPLTPLAGPVPVANPEPLWSAAVIHGIEWRRFEALCEAFYAQAGFSTHSQSHGPDGGVDIWLQSKHIVAPRVVQCKHWRTQQVALRDMREFLGVMASHKLQNGTFVTSSTFTSEAAAFAKKHGIQAQDGAALLKLIGLRTPEQQAALLAVAHEGEYWRPTCASCGIKMVEQPAQSNRAGFWGCTNYRSCRTPRIWKAKTADDGRRTTRR